MPDEGIQTANQIWADKQDLFDLAAFDGKIIFLYTYASQEAFEMFEPEKSATFRLDHWNDVQGILFNRMTGKYESRLVHVEAAAYKKWLAGRENTKVNRGFFLDDWPG